MANTEAYGRKHKEALKYIDEHGVPWHNKSW